MSQLAKKTRPRQPDPLPSYSRGGHASRAKDTRVDRALVSLLQEHGFAAERVPLSGAACGRFGGDVSVPLT
jgi:hypothetical protein